MTADPARNGQLSRTAARGRTGRRDQPVHDRDPAPEVAVAILNDRGVGGTGMAETARRLGRSPEVGHVTDAGGRYGEPTLDPAKSLASWRYEFEAERGVCLPRQSVLIGP